MVLTERAKEIGRHAAMAGAVGAVLALFDILMNQWKESLDGSSGWFLLWSLLPIAGVFCLVFLIVALTQIYLDKLPVRLERHGDIHGWWLNRVFREPNAELLGCSALKISGTRESGFQIEGHFLGNDEREGEFLGRGAASSEDSICFHYEGDEVANPDHGPCFYQFFKVGNEIHFKGGFYGLGLHEARRVKGRRATSQESERLARGHITDVLREYRDGGTIAAHTVARRVWAPGGAVLALLAVTFLALVTAGSFLLVSISRALNAHAEWVHVGRQIADAQHELAILTNERGELKRLVSKERQAGLNDEAQRLARLRKLASRLDEIYDFQPHVVPVTAIDANVARNRLGPVAFRILAQALADASAERPAADAADQRPEITSAAYADKLLAAAGARKIRERNGPPQSGDLIDYPGHYRMFYFRLPNKEFVIGMTPFGVLALEPGFISPALRVQALPAAPPAPLPPKRHGVRTARR